MVNLTEQIMGNAFERLINRKNGIKQFPRFHYVFKEVISQQGIPDFIGLTFTNNNKIDRSIFKIRIKSLNSSAVIYSYLKKKSPRTEAFIINKVGLSAKTTKRVLQELIDENIVVRTVFGSYCIRETFDIPAVDIWAFELKLSNWKRALFQALQYKAFANYVFVVLPPSKENLLKEKAEMFRGFNVGAMTYDLFSNKYKIITMPNRSKPISQIHSLYMLGRLLTEYQTSLLKTTNTSFINELTSGSLDTPTSTPNN